MQKRCLAFLTQSDNELLPLQCSRHVRSASNSLWCEAHAAEYVCDLAQCKMVTFDHETSRLVEACLRKPVHTQRLRDACKQVGPYRYYVLVQKLRSLCETLEGRIFERERMLEKYFGHKTSAAHGTRDFFESDAALLRKHVESIKQAVRHLKPLEVRERELLKVKQEQTLTKKELEHLEAFNSAKTANLYAAYTYILRLFQSAECKWVAYSNRVDDAVASVTLVFAYGDVFACGVFLTTVALCTDIMENMRVGNNVFMYLFADSQLHVSHSLDGLLLMAFPLEIRMESMRWYSGDTVLWMLRDSPVRLVDSARTIISTGSDVLRKSLWNAAHAGLSDPEASIRAPIVYTLGPFVSRDAAISTLLRTTSDCAAPDIHVYTRCFKHAWNLTEGLLHTESEPVGGPAPCTWSGSIAATCLVESIES